MVRGKAVGTKLEVHAWIQDKVRTWCCYCRRGVDTKRGAQSLQQFILSTTLFDA